MHKRKSKKKSQSNHSARVLTRDPQSALAEAVHSSGEIVRDLISTTAPFSHAAPTGPSRIAAEIETLGKKIFFIEKEKEKVKNILN